MSNRAFVAEVARHAVRCASEGCHYTVHAYSLERAQEDCEEHLRTDPRHTGREWIDRDERERRGLEP